MPELCKHDRGCRIHPAPLSAHRHGIADLSSVIQSRDGHRTSVKKSSGPILRVHEDARVSLWSLGKIKHMYAVYLSSASDCTYKFVLPMRSQNEPLSLNDWKGLIADVL